jgi:hypothetical protein
MAGFWQLVVDTVCDLVKQVLHPAVYPVAWCKSSKAGGPAGQLDAIQEMPLMCPDIVNESDISVPSKRRTSCMAKLSTT